MHVHELIRKLTRILVIDVSMSSPVAVLGYQLCKARNMMASWSRPETGVLDELLRHYWTDVVISRLSSCESLDNVSLKGDV